MANKYTNLVGTNKIKDEYTKINMGFDEVEADINTLDARVDTIITTPIEGAAAAQEIVDARVSAVKSKTFATLDARFEESEQDLVTHKAENASKFAVLERYALASVTGQALTVTVANGKELGDREPIMVEVDSAVTGGAITVNYNNAGALALKDIDGNAVTELAKGLHQFQYRTGSPNFFVLAPRGGANVKSIQRGVITKDSGVTFITQSIESVTLANAILLITFKGSSRSSISPNKYAVLGKFKTSDGVTSSQLQFEVYTTGLPVPISWQVIEFNNVKSLQRGILTQVFNATNYNITINSVNLAKSFLITTFKYNQSSPVSGGATLLSKLTSKTNINVEHFDDLTERTIAWQVVEFN